MIVEDRVLDTMCSQSLIYHCIELQEATTYPRTTTNKELGREKFAEYISRTSVELILQSHPISDFPGPVAALQYTASTLRTAIEKKMKQMEEKNK